MVQVLFSVSAFVDPGTKLAVIGSSPTLGSWSLEHAITLYAQSPIYSNVLPTTFMNWCDIPEIELAGSSLVLTGRLPIAYKFIRIHRTNEGSTTTHTPHTHSSGLKKIPEPHEALSESIKPIIEDCERHKTVFKPHKPIFNLIKTQESVWSIKLPQEKDLVQWEGNGSQDNRYLVSIQMGRGYEIAVEEMELVRKRSIDDREDVTKPNTSGWVYLPTADFLEPSGVSECTQTTRYYRTVKDLRFIHFAKVIDNIFVGSCPRRVEHIRLLRDTLNVGCVFNFQAVDDLVSNWLNETDPLEIRTPATLAEIYVDEDVSLVHIPTVDMSTPARSAMMAQSAMLVMSYLFSNPTRAVYIHCNAGVGRAVAGVLSVLHFGLGMQDREAVAFIKQRRPMAFPDMIALRGGLLDFNKKYARAVRELIKNWS